MGNHPRLLQQLQAPIHGRRRQMGDFAQFLLRQACIGLQVAQQYFVIIV